MTRVATPTRRRFGLLSVIALGFIAMATACQPTVFGPGPIDGIGTLHKSSDRPAIEVTIGLGEWNQAVLTFEAASGAVYGPVDASAGVAVIELDADEPGRLVVELTSGITEGDGTAIAAARVFVTDLAGAGAVTCTADGCVTS